MDESIDFSTMKEMKLHRLPLFKFNLHWSSHVGWAVTVTEGTVRMIVTDGTVTILTDLDLDVGVPWAVGEVA